MEEWEKGDALPGGVRGAAIACTRIDRRRGYFVGLRKIHGCTSIPSAGSGVSWWRKRVSIVHCSEVRVRVEQLEGEIENYGEKHHG